MNMFRLRSVFALPSLLLVACATTNVEPPELPEMPAAPEVVLSTPPMRPLVAPQPPAPPSYTLPKVTDVAWQAVWQEDFACLYTAGTGEDDEHTENLPAP